MKRTTAVAIGVFALITLITILTIRAFDTEIEDDEGVIIRAMLSKGGGGANSFYFTIDENRNLVSYRGYMQYLRISEKFDPEGLFISVDRKRTVRMSEEDFQFVIDRAERLQELDIEYDPRRPLGGTDFVLWHGGAQYHIDPGFIRDSQVGVDYLDPRELGEIVQKIVELSPLVSCVGGAGSTDAPGLEGAILHFQSFMRVHTR